MNDWVKQMAEKMGAKIVAELPDAHRGVLGAAHAGHFYRMRMEELRCREGPQAPEKLKSAGELEPQISQPTAQDSPNMRRVVLSTGETVWIPKPPALLAHLEYLIQQLEGVAAAIKVATAAEEGQRRQLEAAENVQPRSGEAER